MPTAENANQRDDSDQESLQIRLRRFIENSDLSFYQIASRIGTSGAILSMWMAGTANPRTAAEREKIEKFLDR